MYGAGYKLEKLKETHNLNHDLTFSAHTIKCVCHSMRSMFRVLGIYNFGFNPKTSSFHKIRTTVVRIASTTESFDHLILFQPITKQQTVGAVPKNTELLSDWLKQCVVDIKKFHLTVIDCPTKV